jgi:hypothetical protein
VTSLTPATVVSVGRPAHPDVRITPVAALLGVWRSPYLRCRDSAEVASRCRPSTCSDWSAVRRLTRRRYLRADGDFGADTGRFAARASRDYEGGVCQSGLIGGIGEVLNEYPDPGRAPLRSLVLPVLGDLSDREVGRHIGVDHKAIGAIRMGGKLRRSTKEKLLGLALGVARYRTG